MNIELPKDAEGREIPLDTKVLYDKDGHPKDVSRMHQGEQGAVRER